jgi:hypothetical protein
MIDEGTTLVVAIGNLLVGALFVIRVTRRTVFWVSIIVGVILGTFGWFFPKIGLYAGIFILLLIVIFELWQYRKKENYAHSHLVFEGGGIRRGLTPVDAAILLDMDAKDLTILSIISLLGKGIINLAADNRDSGLVVVSEYRIREKTINPHERKKMRKAIARKLNQTISPSEDVLIEMIEQNSEKGFGNLQFTVWFEVSRKECENKMAGFDREQTIEYYFDYINHRLTGVIKGHFPRKDYIEWMALEYFLRSKGDNFIAPILNATQPNWLNGDDSLLDWITKLENVVMFSEN